MRIAIFSVMVMVLLATASFAGGLEITEIDVSVDYDEAYTYRVENRARINSASVPVSNNTKMDVDVLPGSGITLTVRVENTFIGEDPKLRGVVVRITIEDIDDGADLDEESIDFDLEPGDDYKPEVKFPIPLDVDAGTYNVIIGAEGEDRNETSYKTELKLKLEVKKQSHDIRITKVLLNPSIVDCNRKTKLAAEIINAGSNAENQVALEFRNANLGINSFDRDVSLASSDDATDEEKSHTKTLNIEVPSFLNAGTYQFLINLYWKNFVLFDKKTVDLIVRDCTSSATKTKPTQEGKKEQEAVTVIQPKEEMEEIPKEGLITSTQETSIFNSPILLSMLLGGFAILVLAGLIVMVYLRKGKPPIK